MHRRGYGQHRSGYQFLRLAVRDPEQSGQRLRMSHPRWKRTGIGGVGAPRPDVCGPFAAPIVTYSDAVTTSGMDCM
jgi:hypothetical protein